MRDGWPRQQEIDEGLHPLYIRRNELTLDRECLFWGYRIIIPNSLKDAVLEELHRTHFGIVRMKEIARSYFWWPKLDIKIEKHLGKYRNHGPYHQQPGVEFMRIFQAHIIIKCSL